MPFAFHSEQYNMPKPMISTFSNLRRGTKKNMIFDSYGFCAYNNVVH